MRLIKIVSIVMLFCSTITGCGKEPATLIIGHRGASREAPENTLASAKRAWELGADAVEVDVYLSRDGRIVVIHDRSTARTGSEDMIVAETDAETLRTLDVGSWKSPEFAGERIPFLEEVIATIPENGRLLVEIKCGPEIIPVLKKVVGESGKRSSITVIGFGYETVVRCKEAMPSIPAFWVCGTAKDERTGDFIPHPATLVEKVKNGGLDGIDVEFHGITGEFVEAVKSAGLGLYTWTVNDLDECRKLTELGVDGITTDRPGWIRGNM